ncbi:MAG TPA: DUF488 domain-containing protein [Defluviicoccus sp.]|nr:DUF488 domain-containing protein [Defluviicoccus sp.]
MPWLATIGYEGAEVQDFLATLRLAGVVTLIDVRQIAASRRPGYSKTALRSLANAAGIRYVHLVGLGDPKEGREAARKGRVAEFQRIFIRHLGTAEAQADLQTASSLAADGGACLLCYERQPEFCHRSIVADALAERVGVEVRHLGVRGGLGKNDECLQPRARAGAGQGAAARG